jgi:hypothetical protein
MERLAISHEISRILTEYSPFTTRFELENWVQDQLEWCFDGLACPSVEHNIKYQGAYIKFLRDTRLFNLTKLTDNSELLECSLPLRNFLIENYGVDTWEEEDSGLRFASCDFELMAMQLTEIMIDWCAHVEFINTVESRQEHWKKRREP